MYVQRTYITYPLHRLIISRLYNVVQPPPHILKRVYYTVRHAIESWASEWDRINIAHG